jgi:spore germination cell wall hydrolase CwlJ-like protein
MPKLRAYDLKHAPKVVAGLIVLGSLIGMTLLTEALARPSDNPPISGAGRLWIDGSYSEAVLQRFGASMEPGALAIAARYAPAKRPLLKDLTGQPSGRPVYETDPGPVVERFQQLTPDQAVAANAAVPFSKLPNPAAKVFKLSGDDAGGDQRALACLTMAIYYEAASESAQGQAAVAQVVLNRLRHPLFPKTVCGVVFQGSKLSTGCQFSFTCDGSLARRPSQAGWKTAKQIAARALAGYVEKSVGEATHYHTQWVVPYWQSSVVKLAKIGAHIFYRWSGGAGLPAAFSGLYAGAEDNPPQIPGFVDTLTPIMVAALTAPGAPAGPGSDKAAKPDVAVAEPAQATPEKVELVAVAAPPPPVPEKPASFFGEQGRRSRLAVGSGW